MAGCYPAPFSTSPPNPGLKLSKPPVIIDTSVLSWRLRSFHEKAYLSTADVAAAASVPNLLPFALAVHVEVRQNGAAILSPASEACAATAVPDLGGERFTRRPWHGDRANG